MTTPSDRAYAAIVLGGLALVLVAAELLLRFVVLAVDDGWPARVAMVYEVHKPDVALGDSHVYRGFVAQDEFANLARGGSSTRALEIVAREYFRYQAPRRAIVQAAPQLFSPEREREGTQQHDRYFAQHRLGLPFVVYLFEPGVAWRLSWLLDPAQLAQRLRRQGLAGKERANFDRFMSERLASFSPEQREAHTRKVVGKSRPLRKLERSQSFRAYRRMIEALLARGAEVCLVRTPVTSEFLRLSAGDPRFAHAERVLRGLAAELGLRYVDFRDLPVALPDRLFVDADHLSLAGAERYTAAVKRACFPDS